MQDLSSKPGARPDVSEDSGQCRVPRVIFRKGYYNPAAARSAVDATTARGANPCQGIRYRWDTLYVPAQFCDGLDQTQLAIRNRFG